MLQAKETRARRYSFSDSTLGIIESILYDGPIRFDCYPDFTVSLGDPRRLKALTLNIKTSGYEALEGVQPLALIYRIYHKCIGINMNFQAISRSAKDKGSTYYY
jgi:hypothetical protein